MSKKVAIEQFVDRIKYLHDSNYGDFKRKLDLALERMWAVLGHDSKEIDILLYDLKKKTVFLSYNGLEIEEARSMALDTVDQIAKKI